MASQNEVHQESGAPTDSQGNKYNGDESPRPVVMETSGQQPAPFSEFDPFRSTRFAQVTGEAQDFLDQVGRQLTGTESLDENELRSLQSDVEERQRWSATRQDAFTGILRLGTKIPPRGKRVL